MKFQNTGIKKRSYMLPEKRGKKYSSQTKYQEYKEEKKYSSQAK